MEEKKFKDFSFDIFGTKWQVKFIDKVQPENADADKFYFGHCDTVHSTIRVAIKDLAGKALPDNIIELSLTHEIVHAIFDGGCYTGTNEDEPLVEWTAKCIRSLIKQKVF